MNKKHGRRWSLIWTKLNDEEFINLVKGSKTYTEVLNALGFQSKGQNNNTLKKRISHLDIDISHFRKNYDAMRLLNIKSKIPLVEILVENSTYSRKHLKKRLIRNGMVPNKCALCGLKDTWKGTPIVLILDHINGISNDNRLENLRFVCPNCNSQLDTHCGKHNKKKKYYCKICGGLKKTKLSTQCVECSVSNRQRKVKDRPSLEQLLEDVEKLNYCGTGRKYGVSDNAIRKWIKKYKIFA